MPESPQTVVGVDGARGGWVAVFAGAGGYRGAGLFATFAELIAAAGDAAIIGVDMPVGLLESGWRDCDTAARAALGSRAATVFPVPPRPALAAADYAAARRICRDDSGKALSKQAYNLAAKIFEVDAFAGDSRIREVHPELSFASLAGQVLPSKKTWAGVAARIAALAGAGFEIPAAIGAAGATAPDDVLDAAAVAWSARRIAGGSAVTFPPAVTQRAGDRPLVIWA